ncbi:DUF488 domain-containing protein [Carnobacterium gallinarum]|uniref:DUF488 domain-containing protein n=1 Tax=Carnobacterium gallinarum TaxID=2749 RepID=UPI00054D8948|nr:DUF488 domain-containing protein [Carnobacterium gallinarum]
MIQLKRVYDTPATSDGYRILVDRIWPRGLSKEKAALGVWAKDIAPTAELRKWFNHEPEKFNLFKTAYEAELARNSNLEDFCLAIREHLAKGNVTLLYGAKSRTCNHAISLKNYLEVLEIF